MRIRYRSAITHGEGTLMNVPYVSEGTVSFFDGTDISAQHELLKKEVQDAFTPWITSYADFLFPTGDSDDTGS